MKGEKKRDAQVEKPQGVIACLTAGFELVARYPQMFILPILLDLYLWLGPRLSVAPLIRDLQAFWRTVPTSDVALASETLQQLLDEVAEYFNLFVLLEPLPLFSVPSLMNQRLVERLPWGARVILEIPSLGLALGWSAVLLVVGMGLAAVYYWQIGSQIQEEVDDLPIIGPPVPLRIWGQLLQLLIGVLGLALVLAIPVSLLTSLLALVSVEVMGLGVTLLLSLVLFVALHCIYVLPGMIQFRKPPLRAVQESFLLVRADFGGALGMVLAMLVLTQGLNFIWTLPPTDQWLTVIGIGGHAVVSTALVVALFIFYQERILYLRSLREAYATGALTSVDT